MTATRAQGAASETLPALKRVLTRDYRLQCVYDAYSTDPVFSALRYANVHMLRGSGCDRPKVVFVVESPSKQDVQAGRFFSGHEAAVVADICKTLDVPQDKTFTTSVIKYPTPYSRAGRDDELRVGAQYLRRELDILDPSIVMVFGRHLSEFMFPGLPFVHNHGYRIEGRRTYVPMFHPSAALRSADIRKATFAAAGRVAAII